MTAQIPLIAEASPPARDWYIYSGQPQARDYLCVVRAKSAATALATARRTFALGRTAWARCPSREERLRDWGNALRSIGGHIS